MPGKGLERERGQIPPWTMAPSDYTRSRVADKEPNGQAKLGSCSLFSSLLRREVLMSSRAHKAGETESKEEIR